MFNNIINIEATVLVHIHEHTVTSGQYPKHMSKVSILHPSGFVQTRTLIGNASRVLKGMAPAGYSVSGYFHNITSTINGNEVTFETFTASQKNIDALKALLDKGVENLPVLSDAAIKSAPAAITEDKEPMPF